MRAWLRRRGTLVVVWMILLASVPRAWAVELLLAPVADTTLQESAPTTNFGSATSLAVVAGTSGRARTLLRFDLSIIPAGSTIDGASLELTVVSASPSPAQLPVTLQRVDAPWLEAAVTWATQPAQTPVGPTLGVGSAASLAAWNAAPLVGAWLAGAPNHGLALQSTGTTAGSRAFASREASVATSRPRLRVSFTPPLDAQTQALRRLQAASSVPVRGGIEDGYPIALALRVPSGGPSGDPYGQARAFLATYGELWGLSASLEELRVERATTEPGRAHVTFQVLRDGLPIVGAVIAVHLEGTAVTRVFATEPPPRETPIDVAPLLGFLEAQSLALAHAATSLPSGPRGIIGQSSLVIYDEALWQDTQAPALPRLGWEIGIAAGPGRYRYYVDARTGAILHRTSLVKSALDLEIFTARGQTSWTCFTWPDDPSILWFTEDGPDEDAADQIDDDGTSADAIIRAVYQFWRDLGWRSYDDDDSQIEMYVHWGTREDNNSFWSEGCSHMEFSTAWTVDDVIGHEFTHGVVDSTADFIYEGQTGALNESVADLYGSLFDPDQDWLIGEGLPLADSPPLRDMSNPPNQNDPDHKLAALSGDGIGIRNTDSDTDDGFVHTNSGIPNKAAVLITDGGVHAGSQIAVVGIGRPAVGALYLRALSVYALNFGWARFYAMRHFVQAAAEDLHGVGSAEACAVENAWGAVGVGDADADCDGVPDPDELDDDDDLVPDERDNCQGAANLGQSDVDGDLLGDVCDPDADADLVPNALDNCPLVSNAGQLDRNADGAGDVCDDQDGDRIVDVDDNCPDVANDQVDSDADGIGNACESDDDDDGAPDGSDNCPLLANAFQGDADADGRGDICDNCSASFNPDQEDIDRDRHGDVCDSDDDGDGSPDSADLCPTRFDPQQLDLDGDGRGFACDQDEAAQFAGPFQGWHEFTIESQGGPVHVPLLPCVADECPLGGEGFAPGTQFAVRLVVPNGFGARVVDERGHQMARASFGGPELQTLDFEVPPSFRFDLDAMALFSGPPVDLALAASEPAATATAAASAPSAAPGDTLFFARRPRFFLELAPRSAAQDGVATRVALSLARFDTAAADGDGDGVADAVDACPTIADLEQADSDADGVGDACDDCVATANGPAAPDAGGASQRDADGDGYGNACDPDLNNDGVVNAVDLARLKSVFFKADATADLDGNGVVNAADLARLKQRFFRPPGPSALAP